MNTSTDQRTFDDIDSLTTGIDIKLVNTHAHGWVVMIASRHLDPDTAHALSVNLAELAAEAELRNLETSRD